MAVTRSAVTNAADKKPVIKNGNITKLRIRVQANGKFLLKSGANNNRIIYTRRSSISSKATGGHLSKPQKDNTYNVAATSILRNKERPEPVGSPPAWSVNRPELCDAIPWFRSSQGGCYYKDGKAFGVLIDADSGDNAYLDDEVVITRVGGYCGKENGKLVLKKDIDEGNHSFVALKFNFEYDLPVGMIIGDNNTVCASKVPARYNVMGYFRITDIWFEKNGRHAGAKIRFEKLNLDSQSWWAAKDQPKRLPLAERTDVETPLPIICSSCETPSHQVYSQGWMCLIPGCSQFWTIDGRAPPTDLRFAPGFINKRHTIPSLMRPQYSLVPDLLSTLPESDKWSKISRIMWKGIVCPNCKRCCARTDWSGWVCPMEKSGCGFSYFSAPDFPELRSIVPDFEMGAVGHRYPTRRKDTVLPRVQYLKNYRVDTFDLGMGNTITHFAANNTVNNRLNGPNDIFRELCTKDIGLKRRGLERAVVDETLTAHFAVNHGMPYKYVASVDSNPFSDAPPYLMRALGRLTWAVRKSVPSTEFLQPNELLTLGYMEKMAIGYHDDGEDTLGPTIGTLSLGAPATMLLRLKSKYFRIPEAKNGTVEPGDLTLPSCLMETERRGLKTLYNSGKIELRQYWERLMALRSANRRKEASPIVSIELNHGDLVVMHGENLQKFFEHSVIPDGDIRFALTARYVMPERLREDERWLGDYTPDPGFEYDGDGDGI